MYPKPTFVNNFLYYNYTTLTPNFSNGQFSQNPYIIYCIIEALLNYVIKPELIKNNKSFFRHRSFYCYFIFQLQFISFLTPTNVLTVTFQSFFIIIVELSLSFRTGVRNLFLMLRVSSVACVLS